MDSSNCTDSCYNMDSCIFTCYRNSDTQVQTKLDAPMPWIGMYIAAASLACSLAMTLDAFNGFRVKKFWLPCKYFSINAFSLTLLAITVKLPLDLTSNTLGYNDKLARVTSLVFISSSMGNFMASLGSMENNEIILNLAALGILVITVAVNVFIHNFQMSFFDLTALAEEVVSMVIMLLLLVNMCCMAIMVPSAKRYIESKYNEMHKSFSDERINELGVVVRRYWVMAATSSPQFVMARSAISATSGLICLLILVLLVEAHVRLRFAGHVIVDVSHYTSSNYGWSITWILYIQSVGVAFGTIAPLLRWYVAAWFKFGEVGRKRFREEFKIEKYWTSKLVEWRENSLSIQIRHNNCRKLLHSAKRLVLNTVIGIQFLFVITSKLVLLFFAFCGGAILLCFHNIKNFKGFFICGLNEMGGSESTADTQLDLSTFVQLLEGEARLPNRILKNICSEVDNIIQIGERNQPMNLIKILHKSVNFNGVREFHSKEVPSLHSQEPPNCWSLPVVTLTSIALALPNITDHKAKQLLNGVSEGLSLVSFIEKTHDENGEIESILDAADMVWVGVELYRKWLDNDLHNITLKGRPHKETLEKLSRIAEKTVKDYMAETEDILMQNPLYWPPKVIAANSMYRVTQTILLDDDEQKTTEDVFDRLSVIISDILAACLTNLGHVIRLKCHKSGIKEREENVRQAATLLGQSRQILEILEQRHDLPSTDAKNAANIEKWRAYLEQNGEDSLPSISASTNITASTQPSQEHVSIDLEV